MESPQATSKSTSGLENSVPYPLHLRVTITARIEPAEALAMTRRAAMMAGLAMVAGIGLKAQSSASPYTSSDDAMKKELEQFKAFIQEHPRALDELKKDPSLIRTAAFSEEHRAVGEYLAEHGKVKDELKKYPNFFANLTATTTGGQHKKKQ